MQLRFPESIAPLRLMPEQRRTFIGSIVSGNIIHYPGANRWQKTAVSTETNGPVNKTALAVTVDGTTDARRWGAMRFTYLCDPVRCRYAVRGCQRHNISAALQYSRRPQFVYQRLRGHSEHTNTRELRPYYFSTAIVRVVHDDKFDVSFALLHEAIQAVPDAGRGIATRDNDRE